MKDFHKIWNKEPKEPFSEKIQRAVKPLPPVKPFIEEAIRRLRYQASKMEQMYRRLQDRDRRLFSTLVQAYIKNDIARATVLANEVAHVRKVAKVVLSSKHALDSVIMRLETWLMVGETASTLAPLVNVISKVGAQIRDIMPTAEGELEKVGALLNDVLSNSGINAYSMPIPMDDEAAKILDEARELAEHQIKEESPALERSYKQNISD